MREATCVILAAGLGTRMGGEKLTRRFRAGTILDAVIDACAGFPTVVIASRSATAAVLRLRDASHRSAAVLRLRDASHRSAQDDIEVIVNDEPERGMAHSLRLADQAIPSDRAIGVLLGDKPLVTKALVRTLIAVDDADVIFPERNGVPGHPVVFSAKARALIVDLPDGDTLQRLRDDPSVTRHAVPVADDGAYVDVDTEDDYRRLID
jgi:molybdenum cofactor cytidylyltransferase